MSKTENSSLGQRLFLARTTAHERRRELTKVTQIELADAMGVSKSYISQIENGLSEIKDMKFTHIIKAAEFLKCDAVWLGHGKGDMEDTAKDLEQIYKVNLYRPSDLMTEKPKPADHLYLRKSLYDQLGENAYATVVTDDCMKGDANKGDVIIIDPDRQMHAKNLVLIKTDGQNYPLLRRYRNNQSTGKLMLAPNDEELPWLLPDDCEIMGVVVQIQRELIDPLMHLVSNNVIPFNRKVS